MSVIPAPEAHSSETFASNVTGKVYHFRRPRNTQASARFMQLPAELRTTILCTLLKSPRAIAWFPSEEGFKLGISAQVVATCQLLHKEASSILYGQNTLRLAFLYKGSDAVLTCLVMGTYVTLVDDPAALPTENYDLLSFAQKNPDSTQFKKYYAALSRIQNVRVEGSFFSEDAVFTTCKVLQPLLQGKNVIFATKVNYPQNLKDGDVDMWQRTCLRSCHILRCREITFEGCKSDCSSLVQEITTSKDPSKDLFTLWKKMHDCVSVLGCIGGEPFDDHPDRAEQLRTMRHAVYGGDAPTVHDCVAKLLKQAAAWEQRWASQETAEAKAQHDREIEMNEANVARVSDLLIEASSMANEGEEL